MRCIDLYQNVICIKNNNNIISNEVFINIPIKIVSFLSGIIIICFVLYWLQPNILLTIQYIVHSYLSSIYPKLYC